MKRTFHNLRLFGSVATLLLVGCGGESALQPDLGPDPTPATEAGPDAPPNPVSQAKSNKSRIDAPQVSQENVATQVLGNNNFGLDLFRHVSGDDNTFLSPHSLAVALAMARAGARGETEAQMATVLRHLLDPEDLHAAFNRLDLDLAAQAAASESLKLVVANAFWGQKAHPFNPPFLDLLAQNYGIGVFEVDFIRAVEEARQTINGWVSLLTMGKIPELLQEDDLNDLTRLVLTNAVYYKANWQDPFNKADSYDRLFYGLQGTRDIEVMTGERYLPYAYRNDFVAVQIPYEGGLSFVAVMPEEGTWQEFKNQLTAETFAKIVDEMTSGAVRLTLPKMDFRSRYSLKDPLSAMGMPLAFDSYVADFTHITKPGTPREQQLVIGDVIHEAWIRVDEKGTEAAAATAVIFADAGVGQPVPPPPTLTFDRPFLFAVVDDATGVLLFLGQLT